MSNVIVIHEYDHDDKSTDVIGVADSIEKANEMIDEYYVDYKQIYFEDIRDSGIEWRKLIRLDDNTTNPYEVTLTLEWFVINKI